MKKLVKESLEVKTYGVDKDFTELVDKAWKEGAIKDFSSKAELADIFSRQDEEEIISYIERLIRSNSLLQYKKVEYKK